MKAIVKNVPCPFALEKAAIKLKYPTPIPFSAAIDVSNNGNKQFFFINNQIKNFKICHCFQHLNKKKTIRLFDF